ncbi:MAG: ABC transporter substrate-binding protein [Chloroflexi bacterium]|nr:ABC transporter substrate-binding protein [Chloroflexota bacterium]
MLLGMSAGDPPDVNPLEAQNRQYFSIWGNAYNHLIQYNWKEPADQIIPDLAESWEIGPDAKTYTFRIREGVKWHDGKTFTAEDAKWAVEAIKDKGPRVKDDLRSIAKVEALDPRTLRITLAQPRASLLGVLGLATVPIVARHVYEAAKGDLRQGPNIGTGPFKEGSYIRGVSAEMVRNPDYFEKELPYLDGIKVIMVRDNTTRLAAFRTKRVDLLSMGATEVNRVELDELKKSVPDLQPNPHVKMAVNIIWPNTNAKPWDDVRVRRAAFLAVDRYQALKVLDDTMAVAGPVVPPNWALPEKELQSIPGYRPNNIENDRREARRLLAEAGYPNGFDTESTAPSNVDRLVKLQVFAVDQLGTVGIRVKSNPLPFAEWSVLRREGTFKLIAIEANVAYPDADAAAANVFPGVFSTLKDDKMVQLFQQQSVEPNLERRRQIVFDLQRRMLEVLNQIPIAWTSDYYPTQPYVKGFVAPLGQWSRHRMDHVWLDK